MALEMPIMFSDLRWLTQQKLLEFYGVQHEKELGWDETPVFVMMGTGKTRGNEKKCRTCGKGISGDGDFCEGCTDKMNEKASKDYFEGLQEEESNISDRVSELNSSP